VIADAAVSGVDVRWLTSWRADTAILPSVIPGLPDLPWFGEKDLPDDFTPGPRDDNHAWKWHVARHVVPDGVPLLWTDNDLDLFILPTWGDASRRRWTLTRPGGTTLIVPSEPHGLYPRHVTQIREWVAEHA